MTDSPSGGGGSGLDITQFMGAADALTGQISQSLKDLAGTMTDYRTATAAEVPALEKKNVADTQIQMIELEKAEKIRGANAEAAAWFGTNKAANSFILAGLGDEIVAGTKDVMARRADIQKRKDASFLDDPFSFILNQISTPFAEEALNFKEATVQQDLDTARGLIARTTEQFTINAAITEGDAEKKANAIRESMLASTAIEVAKSNQRLAALGLNEINVRSVLNRNQFDVANEATNKQAKLIELNLATKAGERGDETLALQKKQFKMMSELHRLEIAAKQGNIDAENAIADKLKTVAPVLGMTAPTRNEWKAMDPRHKQFWLEAAADPSISEQHMLGNNVGQAVEKVNDMGLPLTPGMRVVYDKLDSVRATTIADHSKLTGANGVQWKDLPKDSRANMLNLTMQDALKTEAKNIPDQGGAYSPPPVAAVINIPAVTSTSIAKLLAPQARDPSNPLRAQDVFSAAIMRMTNEDASPEQMADEISTIYKSVIMDNNQQRQYKRFATVPMSEAAGFKTQVSVPLGLVGVQGSEFSYPFNKIQIVDMANTSQLSTLLTRVKIAMSQQASVAPNQPATEDTSSSEPAASRAPVLQPYSPSNRFDRSLNVPQQ